jgi:hypothetical protein
MVASWPLVANGKKKPFFGGRRAGSPVLSLQSAGQIMRSSIFDAEIRAFMSGILASRRSVVKEGDFRLF